MKYKKLRYNIIVFGLVAIIGCCVAFPLITGGSKNDINQGAIEEPSIIEPEIPDEPSEPIDPDLDIPDDSDEEEGEDFEYYKAIDLIDYSLNMLYNGKGFSSTIRQTCTNTATAMGATITVPQESSGTIKRSGNISLQEEYLWSDYTRLGSDQCKNYYSFYYIDKDNNKFVEGKSEDYDRTNKTYNSSAVSSTSMTYTEGMNKWLVMYGDSFPIKTTKSDTIYSDKIEGDYRVIKVIYAVNKLSKNVKEFYGTTGQLNNINYTSLEIVYKINIKNGRMKSISRAEKLTGTGEASGFKTPVTTMAVTTQTFTSWDKEQEIKIPGQN